MARSSISIKGTREGLVIFLDPGCDFEDWKQGLKRHLDSARDFFQGARFLLHPRRELPVEQERELVELASQYGLVYGGCRSPASSPTSAFPPSMTADLGNAHLHRGHLRAGQEILSDTNLVILGDVHPGARVTASGSVVVCGTLLGEVQAGNQGCTSAVVVAYRFAPLRLSIAGVSAPPFTVTLHMVKARLQGNNILLDPLFPHR
ncbi:septum site-determining protein MinC [Desulfothermobacter acidiphilus]|uniref:septum site-determining protein MinC n=1 Tax=Desulfothermobacter acidiphilus TaxID=1938353 RepID=UPI003F8B6826